MVRTFWMLLEYRGTDSAGWFSPHTICVSCIVAYVSHRVKTYHMNCFNAQYSIDPFILKPQSLKISTRRIRDYQFNFRQSWKRSRKPTEMPLKTWNQWKSPVPQKLNPQNPQTNQPKPPPLPPPQRLQKPKLIN